MCGPDGDGDNDGNNGGDNHGDYEVNMIVVMMVIVMVVMVMVRWFVTPQSWQTFRASHSFYGLLAIYSSWGFGSHNQSSGRPV